MEWLEGLGGPFRIDTTSWWVAIGSAALIGFLLGALPAGAAEAIALAAGAIPSPRLRAAVLVAFTAGHVGGKMLWYALGRLGSRVRHAALRRWIDRAKTLAEKHPTLGLGVVVTSASVSVPPFHLVAIAAGIVRAPMAPFFLVAFAGRLLRFSVLAAFPALLRYVLS